MTWHETRARWRILREIAAEAHDDPTGTLPWTEEYADVFGDRASLVAALRYRWRLTQQAQLDLNVPEAVLDERYAALELSQLGVLRIIRRYEAETGREALASAS